MKKRLEKITTRVLPSLGAVGVGFCPLCIVGSASVLTFIGLGALIPIWQWLTFGLLGLGFIGFVIDFKSHRLINPMLMYIIGTFLLYEGRYDYADWKIWVPAIILIFMAIFANKKPFKKNNCQSRVVEEGVKDCCANQK